MLARVVIEGTLMWALVVSLIAIGVGLIGWQLVVELEGEPV